jgi:PAS domain S-box-containing protein
VILTTPNQPAYAHELEGLKQTLSQVSYQNEMMLRWVNGAVLTVDRNGSIQDANAVALQTLGWQKDELIGRQIHETIHHSQDDGSEYPWDFCPVFAAIEDGSSHHVDGDVLWKKDGSSFSADFIVCPTRDEQNQIIGAILTFRNITQQRIEESKRIHSMKLVAIGELSAGIAHEINTPVQFIGNNLAFLQESFSDIFQLIQHYQQLSNAVANDPTYAELSKQLKEQEELTDIAYLLEETPQAFEQTAHGVERVTGLVQGLKGFAHSGSEQSKTASDINKIVENALMVCTNTYKYVAELKTSFGTIPPIKVFPGDIGQVIVNLIVNAAQAIEEQKKPDNTMGCITLTTTTDDDFVLITIEDTGNGIPNEVRERIFDPFFTTKEVGKGSGQGLAISHTIIQEKHGGELNFHSTSGKGTTFTIKLPKN